uniref:Chromosome 2 open reading frame 42 n=1 Tax=Sinocyclocheilus rhinocerous TaxID=307959 RepID=A0A673KV16_9TELE
IAANQQKTFTPAFLSNLGKSTLRGIRKCPQCGVYNGTRGLSCKNKACGTIFRDGDHGTGRLKKGACEVVQVVTDSGGGRAGGPQVFSVRQRGRGSEQQGFVELVLTDTAITTADGTLLTRVNLGRCYMPSLTQPPKSPSMECQTQATPLPLKSSVQEALVATSQAKEELWRLATETQGPLVQRASKGTLIVKCQPGEAHPLGLLHLMVGLSGVKDKTVGAAPFQCACYVPNTKGDLGARSGGQSNINDGENSHQHNLHEHCLHFYACVCAFTSDEKLASEFSAFLNYNMNDATTLSIPEAQQHIEPSISHRPKRLKFVESSTGKLKLMDRPHRMSNLRPTAQRPLLPSTFIENGKPEPLVFHISQAFFNALQQRLSLGSKKRRLPNYTTTFVRNDALPLGSFSKYTWHITNLMHVKRIFDTPELPFELTQSFVKNSDGSYSPYRFRETPPDPASDTCHHSRTNKPLAIRPLELRTFLRVGKCIYSLIMKSDLSVLVLCQIIFPYQFSSPTGPKVIPLATRTVPPNQSPPSQKKKIKN